MAVTAPANTRYGHLEKTNLHEVIINAKISGTVLDIIVIGLVILNLFKVIITLPTTDYPIIIIMSYIILYRPGRGKKLLYVDFS